MSVEAYKALIEVYRAEMYLEWLTTILEKIEGGEDFVGKKIDDKESEGIFLENDITMRDEKVGFGVPVEPQRDFVTLNLFEFNISERKWSQELVMSTFLIEQVPLGAGTFREAYKARQ